jgi:glycosyltransferase involved in cell wall biosynthesis
VTRASVVLPIYNHEAYIRETVLSVCQQSHADTELICIDDGSSDDSINLAEAAIAEGTHPGHLVAQINAGAHNALNRGASLTTGELLFFLNSDDVFDTDRVATFVRLWESQGKPEDFWGFSSAFFIDEDGDTVDPDSLELGHLSYFNACVEQQLWVEELLAWHNVTLTSGNLVVTRSMFDRTGGFAPYRMVHDWDMAFRLLLQSSPHVVARALYGYRIHESNTFRSIPHGDAVRESEEIRIKFQNQRLKDNTDVPYAVNGVPFVDYMRMAFPMKAGMTGL